MKSLLLFSFLALATAPALSKGINTRIVGGSNAHPSQFPYVVAIYRQTANGNYFCAGTILSTEWVLTAAQCVLNALELTIQLGSVSLTGTDPSRVKVATSHYVIHPKYDPESLDNDIALVKFRIPITFTDYIKKVDTLPVSELPDFVSTSALGWGQIDDEHEGIVDKLRWVVVSSITNAECRLTFGDQITDNMLCVEGNYNEGTCYGDTGGPLIQYYTRGITAVVGVSSFLSGIGCEAPHPSGYIRTYPYVDWIRNVTGVN